MNRQALLLVNRHARQGKRALSEAIALLNDMGFDLLLESSARHQNLSDTIRRYSDRVDLVIVGGGDGTLNAAVEGLVDTQLPLAILPLGTANDLARTLNLPAALPQACQVIAEGKLQAIDLGWVNGKHFFNVASLGLSVNITRQLNKEIKRRWGVLAYGISAFQALFKFRPFTAEIRINGESQKVRTAQIAVGNGRHYGGGLTVAADAAIDDQRLDLYSLEIQYWWQMLALLPSMRSGTHASWDFVRAMYGQEIEVYTSRPQPINTDGEITTETPAHFRVIPRAISVMVP
jgi:YegS/Rv2252/BmrU family lipid kinase